MSEGENVATDHEVMLSVREGDINMLGLLFEKHHKKLYNFFLRQTGNVQESEDLVQDVFMRMLKYRHTYRDNGDFAVWMFSIAHNARNDYYKKHARMGIQVDEIDEIISNEPSPEKVVEQKNDIELLQMAMDQLPPEKKELLLMSRFQNLCYKKIGSILGCNEGTVKVRIYRAMKELTEKYFELTGEESYEM